MKKFKSIILAMIVSMVMVAPMSVLAATYSTTFDFTVNLYGSWRDYSAGDIKLVVDSSSYNTGGYNSGSNYFTVALQRDDFWMNPTIGSFQASRDGITSNGWTNLSKDKYRFHLTKANDQWTLKGTIKITQ